MRFTHAGRFLSGIVAPLSALRTSGSPGCGEFPDLLALGKLAESWGFNLLQLLPVNDTGTDSSPYSARSAFALHPLYLRIGELPELAAAEGSTNFPLPSAETYRAEEKSLVERFGGSACVPYEELLEAKLALLWKIWLGKAAGSGSKRGQTPKKGGQTPNEGADPELEPWIEANPWVRAYAAFVELKARNGGRPWWEWNEHRDPGRDEIEALWKTDGLSDRLRFHAWVQMLAEGQFRGAAEALAGKGIALMGDLPILMSDDSADVWARRSCFNRELRAGAPPDMYSWLGQNWGFPIYDWAALADEDYGFWVERLAEADKFYSAYRIDHVLGFFRIWCLGEREGSGYLGRFLPGSPIGRGELEAAGFSPERLRWLSLPHVPTQRLVQAAGEAAARGAIHAALDRIGDEELFLFKPAIMGERDIEALPGVSPAARDCLLQSWRDRVLFEESPGSFVPAWRYREASAWPTLSEGERSCLEGLVSRKAAEAEELWASTGERLLGRLQKAVPMLPCAEDLGAVPDCVPCVLGSLGILGLRVLRWTRRWSEPGQPYVSPADYPRLSVACASVHDSSSLRSWWEDEADRAGTWGFASAFLGRELGPCPEKLGPRDGENLLELIAASNSLFAVYPMQDLIGLSETSRPADPREERINVPGTVGRGNWSYRMPVTIDELLGDKALAASAKRLVKARPKPEKRGVPDDGRA